MAWFVVNFHSTNTNHCSLLLVTLLSQMLSWRIQDECVEVRTTFIHKLHKGLISLRLPLQYLSIMCLAANETDKSRRTVVKQMLTANISRRREYLRQNSIANSLSCTFFCSFCNSLIQVKRIRYFWWYISDIFDVKMYVMPTLMEWQASNASGHCCALNPSLLWSCLVGLREAYLTSKEALLQHFPKVDFFLGGEGDPA